MRRPSGDQLGCVFPALSVVRRRKPVPSLLMTKREYFPSRFDSNTSFRPSGDQAGFQYSMRRDNATASVDAWAHSVRADRRINSQLQRAMTFLHDLRKWFVWKVSTNCASVV